MANIGNNFAELDDAASGDGSPAVLVTTVSVCCGESKYGVLYWKMNIGLTSSVTGCTTFSNITHFT